jgi:hypothetical protein
MKKQILIACLLCVKLVIYSQETIPVSGGEIKGTAGSLSYTVGQLFYTTNGSIAQGVQQAYEFQTLSNSELTTVNLTISTFPNPTSDYITLKISDKSLENLEYIMYDLNGKSIAKGRISMANTNIKMQHAAIGIYQLKVTQKQKIIKSFKIIKK